MAVASELQDEYADGVVLVDLAPVHEAVLVAPTLLQALEIRAVGGRNAWKAILADLRPRHVLLVLDNLEHLLEAASSLGDLLGHCPRLGILATSRAALGLRAEHRYALAPLALPLLPAAGMAEVGEAAAVRLFVARAQAVLPSFALTAGNCAPVAMLCHRLDGLPLAIELAAARIPVLSPAALLARLERRLSLLVTGPRDLPARQQTLRATIDWSYDFLAPDEQALFARLGAFAGRATLPAVEAIANSDDALDVLALLQSLVEKSLVVPVRADEPRFGMLETLREYAREQLQRRGEIERLGQLHASYFLALAEDAAARARPENLDWVDDLEAEHDDLRAALRWFVDRQDPERGWRIGAVLAKLWWWRGYVVEARAQLAALLALPRTSASLATWQRALDTGAEAAFHQGDYPTAQDLYEERLSLARAVGDHAAIVATLNQLGHMLRELGDDRGASERLEEALAEARTRGDRREEAIALDRLGTVAHARADYPLARARYDESLKIGREIGDRLLLAWTPHNLGCLALDEGDVARARPLLVNSLSHWRARRATDGLVHGLAALASLAAAEGRPERAIRLAGAAAGLSEASGCPIVPFYRGRFERWLEQARHSVDQAAADRAWEDGRAMPPELAIAHALGDESESDAKARG
jgi:predicted ATPase